ncbi:MAG: inositol monophosphatase family protein [Promethearchaeota archaeon]
MASHFLDVSVGASREAGKLLLRLFNKKTKLSFKADNSIVTEADLKADTLLKNTITESFPHHSIISEESGKNYQDSDYLWIIDPLDGSTNFSVKNPFFAVSIGLLYKHKPILGVVYAPFQDELFVAENNKGAYLNNQAITVDERATLEKSFIAFCNGRDLESREQIVKIYKELKMVNNKVRQVGAAALELCFVASGRFGGFIMPGVNAWDVIAGALIVKEARGITTDFKNKRFNIHSSNIIACSPSIQEYLLEIVKKI